jgi:hypothetical protein
MTTEVPATEAGRQFLANLVGRFGGAAMDPTSYQLTVEDVLAIEAERVAALGDALRKADVECDYSGLTADVDRDIRMALPSQVASFHEPYVRVGALRALLSAATPAPARDLTRYSLVPTLNGTQAMEPDAEGHWVWYDDVAPARETQEGAERG